MKELKVLPIVFSVFLAIACEKEEPRPANADSTSTDTTEVKSGEAVNYLALGDSYTIGHGVAGSERYPVILAKELEEEGIKIQDPEIIATTGWTTADLKRGIANANVEGKEYDLVSLLIGVNNQYQGRSLEEYRKEFRELLLQSIDFAKGNKDKVFVISIPDYGYTPFGASRREEISPEIDAFNAANKEITASLGLRYINITPISRNGLSDPTLVAGDGLHPSGKMYQQWVDLMLEEVIAMVEAP
jgi:lysophospholipase L1-like esterase